ncbi:MAG: MBL fold metallo-hydrolase, partial [Gammaproteobacteria bacterium]|nr:MBL fold metallo-hydrolase [Gammaproteobacteria bacterium]
PVRINQARLPLGRLNGVFLTHYHSDHIASLPDVNLTSWVQGRKASLNVYGPEGIERVINGFNEAYALDRQYRTEHHGEALLPVAAGPMRAQSIEVGTVVWQDDLLSIRSFAVDHAPVAPAVGYRIDYKGRSVVISGDTLATDSLFAAAQGADLLLHDALSRKMLERMIKVAKAQEVPVIPQIMQDVMDYHADSLSLEAQAKAAGVRQLAYYHLVPVPPNDLAQKLFVRGLESSTLLVSDLQTFDLSPDSDRIDIYTP